MAFQLDTAQADTSARHRANGSTQGVATANASRAGLKTMVSRTMARGLIQAAATPLAIEAPM